MRFRDIKSGLEEKIFRVEEKIIGNLPRHKAGYPLIGLWRGATQEKLARKNKVNRWTYNISSLIFINAGLVAAAQGANYLVNNVLNWDVGWVYYAANGWTIKSLLSNTARIGWMLVSRKPKGEFWLELVNHGILDGIAGFRYITQSIKRKSERYEKHVGVDDYRIEEEESHNNRKF